MLSRHKPAVNPVKCVTNPLNTRFWDTLYRSFASFDIHDLFSGDLLTVLSELVIGFGSKIATFSGFSTVFGHFVSKTPSWRDAKVIGPEGGNDRKYPKSGVFSGIFGVIS